MTGSHSSNATKPHDWLRSLLVGVILGGALVGAGACGDLGFSLSLRSGDNLFTVEMAPGGTVHAD